MAEEIVEDNVEQDKKLSRKEKRRLKKLAKKEESIDSESPGISAVFVTFAIALVWLAIIGLLIKLDIGGFGSTILRPIIKDIPVVNLILPVDEEAVSQAKENSPYANMDEALQQIKTLEQELETAQNDSATKDATISDLNKEIERLKVFEANQTAFEEEKTKFYEEVVNTDNAPDISEYKKYYESIDAENAAKIYKEVTQQLYNEEQMAEYAKTYSSMKPAQAASIFATMTDDLDLVAKILNSLSTEQRGEILGAMDPTIAAKLTKLLEP